MTWQTEIKPNSPRIPSLSNVIKTAKWTGNKCELLSLQGTFFCCLRNWWWKYSFSSDVQQKWCIPMRGQSERRGWGGGRAAEELRGRWSEPRRAQRWWSPAGWRWSVCWSRTGTVIPECRLLGNWAERSLSQSSPLQPGPKRSCF